MTTKLQRRDCTASDADGSIESYDGNATWSKPPNLGIALVRSLWWLWCEREVDPARGRGPSMPEVQQCIVQRAQQTRTKLERTGLRWSSCSHCDNKGGHDHHFQGGRGGRYGTYDDSAWRNRARRGPATTQGGRGIKTSLVLTVQPVKYVGSIPPYPRYRWSFMGCASWAVPRNPLLLWAGTGPW